MSSLWKTEDFLAELLHLQKLCHLLPDEAQHGPMVTAFLLKAQAVQKWNSQDIVALLEKTQELNFSPGMSSQLKDGITKLCQNEGSHVKLVQAGQIVSNLAPYLTEEDWLQLANKRSQVCQLTVLAQRLREMGLTSLKEDTKSQAVALWLYSHVELQGLPEPQATTLHTMVAEFQAVFQSLPPNPSVPSLHTYPDNLAALPEDWKKKAYGSEEPAGRIVHLQLWKKKVRLRITAARLATSKEAAKKTAPCQQNGVVPLLEQLLAKFPATQKAEQEVAFVDKGRKEEPASVAMPNSKPMAVPPLALPKPAPQEQQVVLPETKQPEQPKHKQQEEPKPEAIKKPLAAFEEEAYQAFTKKEAGKDHKKEQALKKKPASAKMCQGQCFEKTCCCHCQGKAFQPSGTSSKQTKQSLPRTARLHKVQGQQKWLRLLYPAWFPGPEASSCRHGCNGTKAMPKSRKHRSDLLCHQAHAEGKAQGLQGCSLESQAAGEPIPGAEAAKAKPGKSYCWLLTAYQALNIASLSKAFNLSAPEALNLSSSWKAFECKAAAIDHKVSIFHIFPQPKLQWKKAQPSALHYHEMKLHVSFFFLLYLHLSEKKPSASNIHCIDQWQ